MSKLDLNIRYTSQKESTELTVEANYESTEKQNDQSPRSVVGLVLDYLPLAVNLIVMTVPVISDALTHLI
ncbi:hypothetical protein [Agarivorans aestuarii]|uniref:hypothetical protein n=1 Tax=Agarivorans aestuarii TaxID=1563703 RepID=UPI001C81DA26|nr:hypothetical protein [Agarivorans aestuarii]